jgi:glucose-6-phosphate isomerase
MSRSAFNLPVWNALSGYAAKMDQPDAHLRILLQDPERIKNFALKGAGLLFDFSRQRLDAEGLTLLLDLARDCQLVDRFNALMAGAILNTSEKRAAF